MPESKQIPTSTIVTNPTPSTIKIFTFFNDGVSNTLFAFISDIVQINGGINFIEGELGIIMTNSPIDIDFNLNGNGDLIVTTSIAENDANRYSINANGELIYTSP